MIEGLILEYWGVNINIVIATNAILWIGLNMWFSKIIERKHNTYLLLQ